MQILGQLSHLTQKKEKTIPSRGIGQACPLSPHLYITCAEALPGILNSKFSDGKLKGFKINCRVPSITNTTYCDDILVFEGVVTARSMRSLTALIVICLGWARLSINWNQASSSAPIPPRSLVIPSINLLVSNICKRMNVSRGSCVAWKRLDCSIQIA